MFCRDDDLGSIGKAGSFRFAVALAAASVLCAPVQAAETTPKIVTEVTEAEGLSITVEDQQLVVRGKQTDDADGRVFLHRGIAARQFQRSFVLADGVDVGAANLENGLLHIDLQRTEPETVVQTIKINKT